MFLEALRASKYSEVMNSSAKSSQDAASGSLSHSAQKPSSGARTFAIGDVHGCAVELEALLEKLALHSHDTVVFVGDYIDRGPASRQVIDIVLELRKRCHVVTLKGNHEAMFLDFLEHPETSGAGLFILNGGSATLANYLTEDGAIELPEAHLKFLQELRLFHETDEHFFVHAGVPEIPLAQISVEAHAQALMWTRFPFLQSDFAWEKTVIHGHTPVSEVDIYPNRINIDTGCVYGLKLSAIDVESREIFEVEKGSAGEQPTMPREQESGRIAMRFKGELPVYAKRGDEEVRNYRTLNYNQFGILMKELSFKYDYALMAGDVIEGTIGDDPEKAVKFTGTVVRCEARSGTVVYGVRIERVSGDVGGPQWIERPTG